MVRQITMTTMTALAIGVFAVHVGAETLAYHKEPYKVTLRADASAESDAAHIIAETVSAKGTPHLRVHFGDFHLGDQSYITLTSLEDGGFQVLDAATLPYGPTPAPSSMVMRSSSSFTPHPATQMPSSKSSRLRFTTWASRWRVMTTPSRAVASAAIRITGSRPTIVEQAGCSSAAARAG